MSQPIGPGDLVECVDPNTPRTRVLRLGAIYTVARVVPGPFLRCDFGPLLREAHTPNPFGWADYRFRPISRRSDFERFLTEVTAPRDDVGESADPTIPAKEPHHAVR